MSHLFLLDRTPLLLEGVRRHEKRWKEAMRDLKRAAASGRIKVARHVSGLERRGKLPDETDAQFAQRLLDAEDTKREKVFNKPEMAGTLAALRDRESRLHDKYMAAEQRRDEKHKRKEDERRRQLMMKASIPNLGSYNSRAPKARNLIDPSKVTSGPYEN